jgi:hypothetical protein
MFPELHGFLRLRCLLDKTKRVAQLRGASLDYFPRIPVKNHTGNQEQIHDVGLADDVLFYLAPKKYAKKNLKILPCGCF